MAEFLHIGTIRRAHGLAGQVKVALDNAESEVLEHISAIWTHTVGGEKAVKLSQLKKRPLKSVRSLKDGLYLVTLDGIQNRDAAEAIQLEEVYADRAELPELSDDEVYQQDLIGCTVILGDGAAVGVVSDIEKMNGNFLLVVQRPGRQDALVPLVAEMITDVDLVARTVQIDPPEGLLDLDLPGA